jgi:TonB family protein
MRSRFVSILAAAALATFAAAWSWFLGPRLPGHYYAASELDRVAQPLRLVDLHVEGREGIDYYGLLRMDVYIDADGSVSRVEVLEASVPRALLERAAQAFAQARFDAARRRGLPVRSVKRVEVRFKPPIEGLQFLDPAAH